MRAAVTGSGGFLGRHMAAELERRGYRVMRWEIRDGWDAFDLFSPKTVFSRQVFDLVVHCAASEPHRAAIDTQPASHLTNATLDAAMFRWAVSTGQGRILYFSSCAALDRTLDAYGHVKAHGERMAHQARAAGVPVTVVRPYSGYGEDQGEAWPFGAFVGRAKRHEDPFPLWNAAAVRDWIHVDDVIAGALAVADSGTEDAISLCTGIGTSCQDLARMVTDEAGYRPHFEPRGDMPQGVARRVGNPARMLKLYTPVVSLAEGVKRALA